MLHLRLTPYPLDMATLLHETYPCQNQLDQIAKGRKSMPIRRRGSDAYISDKLPTSWFTSVLRELTRILDMRPGTGTMA
jgi:hypothetical protein